MTPTSSANEMSELVFADTGYILALVNEKDQHVTKISRSVPEYSVPEYPSPISPQRCRIRPHNRITTCNAGLDRPDSDQRHLSETITVSSVSADKSPPLNIRIKGPQRALIERAAKQADKSISDFVRDAALQEAQNALLDTTRIELDPAAWEQFIAVLDAPPAENPRLRDLMSRKAPWER